MLIPAGTLTFEGKRRLGNKREVAPLAQSSYLLQLGQSQRVVVFDFELHEAHVGWMGQLRDDTESGKQSAMMERRDRERERASGKLSSFGLSVRLQSKLRRGQPVEGLDVDNGFGIGHVVFLGNHGALLVHHHHGVSEGHPTPQQTVQTVQRHKTGEGDDT